MNSSVEEKIEFDPEKDSAKKTQKRENIMEKDRKGQSDDATVRITLSANRPGRKTFSFTAIPRTRQLQSRGLVKRCLSPLLLILLLSGMPEDLAAEGESVSVRTSQIHENFSMVLKHTMEKVNSSGGEILLVSSPDGGITARAVQGTLLRKFQPVSMIKPLIIVTAIREGIVKGDTQIDCLDGVLEIEGRCFRDIKGYGKLSVCDILKTRSNIGAIRIAQMLGKEKVLRALKEFGFRVPHKETLSDGAFATLAIGMNFEVTVEQLIAAYATLSKMPQSIRQILVEGSYAGESGFAYCATNLQAHICEGFCLGFFPSDKPNHILLVRFRGKTGHFCGHRTPLSVWKNLVKKISEEKGKYENQVRVQ